MPLRVFALDMAFFGHCKVAAFGKNLVSKIEGLPLGREKAVKVCSRERAECAAQNDDRSLLLEPRLVLVASAHPLGRLRRSRAIEVSGP